MPILAAEFKDDFAPDAKYLYQRKDGKVLEQPRPRLAFQFHLVAGMTLDPAAVSKAWCHQRGYVCFIDEIHHKKVKVGETFGEE
jgi:hypothetical protein